MEEKNRSWEKTLERAAYNQLTRKLPLQMDLYFLVNSICVLRLKRKSSLFIISTIILALYTYSIFCLFRLIMCQFCARNDSREWHCKDLRRGAFKLFTPGANACDYCYFIRGECINWKENSIVSQIKMQSGWLHQNIFTLLRRCALSFSLTLECIMSIMYAWKSSGWSLLTSLADVTHSAAGNSTFSADFLSLFAE